MALVVSNPVHIFNATPGIRESMRLVTATITVSNDDTYTTGGYSLSPELFGLAGYYEVLVSDRDYIYEYVSNKLKVSNRTATAAGKKSFTYVADVSDTESDKLIGSITDPNANWNLNTLVDVFVSNASAAAPAVPADQNVVIEVGGVEVSELTIEDGVSAADIGLEEALGEIDDIEVLVNTPADGWIESLAVTLVLSSGSNNDVTLVSEVEDASEEMRGRSFTVVIIGY